jgi:Fe-S-cluster containining protein
LTKGLKIQMTVNPCLKCGACCAFFRASFYWTECDEVTPGGVPVDLTDKLNDFCLVMKGTNQPTPRCACLSGEIGRRVFCTIYAQRASICRDFDPSWIDGKQNVRCDKARMAWGLTPLTPESWQDTPILPRAA